MPRLTPPNPQTVKTDEDKEIAKRVEAGVGTYGDWRAVDRKIWYGTLLNSPPLAELLRIEGQYWNKAFSPYLFNLGLMVAGATLKSNFLLKGHMPDAIDAGIGRNTLLALLDGTDTFRDHDEKALIVFLRAVMRDEMTDAVFEPMVTKLGAKAVLDLVGFAAYLTQAQRMFSALGMIEPPKRELRDLLDTLTRAA